MVRSRPAARQISGFPENRHFRQFASKAAELSAFCLRLASDAAFRRFPAEEPGLDSNPKLFIDLWGKRGVYCYVLFWVKVSCLLLLEKVFQRLNPYSGPVNPIFVIRTP